MLALYGAGRPAESLEVYHRIRHTLAEELGVDPGPTLRELESAILRHDATLTWAPPAVHDPPGILLLRSSSAPGRRRTVKTTGPCSRP
jgi:hypothetical protein